MEHKLDPEAIKAIEGFVRAHFGREVAAVEIVPGGDVDGETILNVRVIFAKKPDTSGLRAMVRNVRSDIIRYDAFPVFTFASRNPLVGAAA